MKKCTINGLTVTVETEKGHGNLTLTTGLNQQDSMSGTIPMLELAMFGDEIKTALEDKLKELGYNQVEEEGGENEELLP